MGSAVIASCPCGFRTKNLLVGRGMSDYETLCRYPAYCKGCMALVSTNMLEVPHTCNRCGSEVLPYNSPELRATQTGKVVARCNLKEGEDVFLTDDEHLCPACGLYQMRFEHGTILWD